MDNYKEPNKKPEKDEMAAAIELVRTSREKVDAARTQFTAPQQVSDTLDVYERSVDELLEKIQ